MYFKHLRTAILLYKLPKTKNSSHGKERLSNFQNDELRQSLKEWKHTDSNRGPSACKADALNQLSYASKGSAKINSFRISPNSFFILARNYQYASFTRKNSPSF